MTTSHSRAQPPWVDPDPRCAATYANDAFGVDRKNKRLRRARQNVNFTMVNDGAGQAHIFLQSFRRIRKGETLWTSSSSR